ncbi:uncharacterized protein M421DRAFT_36146, partial [Didymella exigua CBS 183.55]
ALKQDTTLTILRATTIYKVLERMLRQQRARTLLRRDCKVNLIKLTSTEEEVIMQHILKLDERGYLPQLTNVEDMANSLL